MKSMKNIILFIFIGLSITFLIPNDSIAAQKAKTFSSTVAKAGLSHVSKGATDFYDYSELAVKIGLSELKHLKRIEGRLNNGASLARNLAYQRLNVKTAQKELQLITKATISGYSFLNRQHSKNVYRFLENEYILELRRKGKAKRK